ncbi:MAG: cystathionine gamma-synthase family protein [Crenarchaeota archaeon]|nr:cystathionine gamma-synthase family protein [Thermoproteota archaeon]
MAVGGYPATEVLRRLRRIGGEGEDVVPPISVSAIYAFRGGSPGDPTREMKYGRENNPTTILLEEALAAAEEAEWCLAFNSGMAALAAVAQALAEEAAEAGGRLRVVASRLLYGSTRGLLDRLGRLGVLEARYAGPPWEELLEAAGDVDAVIVETMGNPTLRVPPLERLASRCRPGCTLVVDNTFASPVLYRPLSRLPGRVLVVESLSKYIGGHNDLVGGAVCGRGLPGLRERLWHIRRLAGTILQGLEAFLAARGLKTLHLRVPYSSRSAMEIAGRLEEHPRVGRVYYPGLPSHPDHGEALRMFPGLYGGVVSFEVKGGVEAARRVLARLRLVAPSPSLGGVESVLAYPYESSHRGLSEEEKARLGITPGLLRLSVGLEDPEDILADILAALEG